MIIGVDLRPINTGEKSGVEEYIVNLLPHLFLIDRKNQYKLFINSFSLPKFNFKKLEKFKNIRLYFFSYPNKVLNSAFTFFKFPSQDQMMGGADLFFSPNLIFTHLSKKCRQVITFHDLSFERYPEFFSLKRRLWHKFILPEEAAKQASGIIAVSHSTAADLQELYQVPPEKIKVIYSGVLGRFKPRSLEDPAVAAVRRKYHLPRHFILYLGTIEPRKNLEGLLLAFGNLKKRRKGDLKLVIAGRPGWLYKNVYKLASQSWVSRDIIFTGFITDQDKPYLYNLADVFVYPSFYEGFGFPPLEAMASGAPIISSHISSLPEVVGHAGILIDPYNINEIKAAMEQTLDNQDLKQALIEKGKRQAKNFNWPTTARQTLDFFEAIMHS